MLTEALHCHVLHGVEACARTSFERENGLYRLQSPSLEGE
jgi:hypothetical protein